MRYHARTETQGGAARAEGAGRQAMLARCRGGGRCTSGTATRLSSFAARRRGSRGPSEGGEQIMFFFFLKNGRGGRARKDRGRANELAPWPWNISSRGSSVLNHD